MSMHMQFNSTHVVMALAYCMSSVNDGLSMPISSVISFKSAVSNEKKNASFPDFFCLKSAARSQIRYLHTYFKNIYLFEKKIAYHIYVSSHPFSMLTRFLTLDWQ